MTEWLGIDEDDNGQQELDVGGGAVMSTGPLKWHQCLDSGV